MAEVNGIELDWTDLGIDHTPRSAGFLNFLNRPVQENGRAVLIAYDRGNKNVWLVGWNDVTRQLEWTLSTNIANFGDLLDGQHLLFFDDFNGDGNDDILVNNAVDGNWFLGTSNGYSFSWSPQPIANTRNFGNLVDGDHLFSSGQFDRVGRAEVLFNYVRDGNWFLGKYDGNALAWCAAGNTSQFGNLLDGAHILLSSDATHNYGPKFKGVRFSLNGQPGYLFHFAQDGNWVYANASANSPNCVNTTLAWSSIGDTRGSGAAHDFGDLLDARHSVWLLDVDGDGTTEVLFHYAVDGNWWLGAMSNASLVWTLMSNTKELADDLLDVDHEFLVGSFKTRGREAILFHSYSHQSWWLGAIENSVGIGWSRLVNRTAP